MIETARLRLRPRTLADLELIVAMDADPCVRRHIGGPLDPVSRRAELRSRILEGRPEPHASWAIEWNGRPGFLGICELSLGEETGCSQVGWRLLRPNWRQGIASEAAQAILDRALFTLGLDPVVALVHPENQASICVAAKIGMRYSGLTSFRGAPQLIYRADALRGGKARSGNRVTTTKLKR
jgi:RimJ/RimL family protein N-acetyltransferase